MTDDRPPVTGSRHVLPFERLSPDAFERLCLGLLRAEGFERVRHLGASGSDGGIDLAAIEKGTPVAIQCKRHEELGPADAQEAVRRLLARPWDPPAERLYLLVSTTVSRDAEERPRAASGGLPVEVWALTELDARVNDQPELVERFFQIGADGSMTVKAVDGGVAAGGDAHFEARDRGIVATGNVTIHAPSAREVAGVARFRCVPPAPPPEFTGREEDIAEITRQLVSGENVGITAALQGMGGVGKTSLALKVAERLDRDHRDALPGGVLWSKVGPDPDAVGILDGWAAQAGASLDPGRFPTAESRAPLVRQALKRLGKLCVVLDDVWEASAGRTLLEAIPSGCPRLVTTRKVEVAKGLHCIPRRLDALHSGEAVELLRRLVGSLDRYEAAALKVVGLVEGLPLAIEIAAGQVDDPAELPAFAERLEKRPRLEILSLGKETRDESVETCLALSYADLDAEDQRRFRALGILAQAPFDDGYLAAVWGEETVDEVARQRFLRRALVQRMPESGLLRQHALLRAYAEALLARAGEFEITSDRFVAHCEAFVEQANWQAVEPVYEQVRSGWARLVGATPERMASYALAAVPFQTLRGRSRDSLCWLEHITSCTPHDLPRARRARILHDVAATYSDLGLKHDALRGFEEALAILREIGDRQGEGVTLNNIANVLAELSRPRDALMRFEEALTVHRELGNRRDEGVTLNNIGKIYSDLGHKQEALRRLRGARALLRDSGDLGTEGHNVNNIGGVYFDLGRWESALKRFEEALGILRQVGDRSGEGIVLNNIALANDELNRRGDALRRYDEALSVAREVGDRWGEALTLFNISNCLESLKRRNEAVAALEACVALEAELGHPNLADDRKALKRLRAKPAADAEQPTAS